MFKKCLVLAAAACLFSSATAQRKSTFGLTVGGGLSRPVLSSSFKKEFDRREHEISRFIGAHWMRALPNNAWLKGGLEYSMHGFTAYTDRTHWASEFDFANQRDPKLDDWAKTINHFSEATVSIKKGFGSKAWKPFAEAGGGIGANFHQQAKTNHNQIIAPTEFDEVSRPQASFRAGIGIMRTTQRGGAHSLFINGRFYLTPLEIDSKSQQYRYAAAMLGYEFDF